MVRTDATVDPEEANKTTDEEARPSKRAKADVPDPVHDDVLENTKPDISDVLSLVLANGWIPWYNGIRLAAVSKFVKHLWEKHRDRLAEDALMILAAPILLFRVKGPGLS
jgi:hypothetical protein